MNGQREEKNKSRVRTPDRQALKKMEKMEKFYLHRSRQMRILGRGRRCCGYRSETG